MQHLVTSKYTQIIASERIITQYNVVQSKAACRLTALHYNANAIHRPYHRFVSQITDCRRHHVHASTRQSVCDKMNEVSQLASLYELQEVTQLVEIK